MASTPPIPDDLRHIHSVLAICGLPYARQPDTVRRFERQQGRMSLVVHAGELKGPDGKSVSQPLPYGSRARLLMLHLCSESIRQKSPTIQIEDSLSAFIRALGYPVTGGPRGTLTAFKQQLNALAACHLQIGMWDGNRARTINAVPFSEIDVWMPTNPAQRILWPSQITFSLDFYKTLTAHALPVNVQAVRAFANSPRKLDILFWLGLRLNSLRKPTSVSGSPPGFAGEAVAV
ncbi:MAG: replication protein RepA [Hyphomicrobium sp.]